MTDIDIETIDLIAEEAARVIREKSRVIRCMRRELSVLRFVVVCFALCFIIIFTAAALALFF